ncbi:MAG: ABC transporter permease, partial [Cyclobacteriaceae bacterium]|nr:ABC transporter permease [Cyclobacteriaceae bacterium]
MKQFIVFVRKEFRHIFRDRKSLLIIIMMPIVQIILFGFALTNEIKNSNIAVLDNAKDEASQALIQRLDASRYFKVTQYLPTQADASDPNTATTVTNYASSILSDYQQEVNGNIQLPYTIKPQVRMLYNPQLKGAYNFVPGVMAMILILICAMMTSVAIVREREINTMEVLLVSP